MNWKRDVTDNAKFLLAKGFEITMIKDEGMGKIAKLSLPYFSVVFIYDKGPVHCDIETKYGGIELIYLANFLNDKKVIYEIPMFYWENINSTDRYIKFFDHIFENEFLKIMQFISIAGKNDFEEAIKFQYSERKGH